MRGVGNGPLEWPVTAMVAVPYAHVLLELAAAVLAITIAMRLLAGRVQDGTVVRAHRCALRDRPRGQAAVIERPLDGAPRRRRRVVG